MRRIITAYMAIIVFTAAILCGCSVSEAEKRFSKGTSINGVDVSGMNRAEAKEKLDGELKAQLSEIEYSINTGEETVKLKAEELGISFDADAAIESGIENGGEIKAQLALNEQKARQCLEGISRKFTKMAVEAYAEYDSCGEFKFYKAKTGSKPDIDGIIDSLKASLTSSKSETLIAKMTDIAPSGTTYEELVENNSVIAEFTTYYDHSPYNAKNRVKNIVKAAERVNGKRLMPGEKFDTNAVLGDRNGENGWFKAPGIRDGKYAQEYGGGVCQVSTTLYNAALLANLEIVERTHHSWPIGYVDIGRDATISTGGPNLIFANNTDSPITVSAVTNDSDNSITVRIFGKKPTGYAYTELSSKQTGTISAPKPEYVYDKSLSAGQYVKDRDARNGKKAVTVRRFYDENDKLIKEETVTHDTYKAFAARILYGK